VAQAAIEYTRALEIMLAIQYWPRALRTLVDVAEFLAAADRVQEAMILLQAVPSHPSADAPLTERIAALSAEVTVEGNPTSAPLPGDESVLDLPQIIADTLSWLSELTADERRSSIDKLVLTANQKLIEPLTERELEVLQLLSDGRTNPQIAEELTISIGTVKSYTAHIYGKLAVRNRTQASKRARELGLLR
jgi:ATP/maltotriose-dependent transcriptional regulator MalT